MSDARAAGGEANQETLSDARAAGGEANQETLSDAGQAIEQALGALGVSYESPRPGAYLVRLEGQHKLATMTWLIAGTHSLHVEAFFCRQPDENHARFYRFLLERGARMYGVHFALDPAGDVYLVGRLPLNSITEAEIDRLLGCVLSYSDESFDMALQIGFGSSIRREWAWRVKRGERLDNLRAFAQFADPAKSKQSADPAKSKQSADPAKSKQSADPAQQSADPAQQSADPGPPGSAPGPDSSAG